jgi:hypothetical protein
MSAGRQPGFVIGGQGTEPLPWGLGYVVYKKSFAAEILIDPTSPPREGP